MSATSAPSAARKAESTRPRSTSVLSADWHEKCPPFFDVSRCYIRTYSYFAFFSGFSQLNNTSSNKKITEISERVQNVKIFEDDFLYVSKKFNFGRFVLDKTFIFDRFF